MANHYEKNKRLYMRETDCGILILAGGSSSRLGQPKQLLPYHDKTLLEHTVDEAIATNMFPIALVLGANHDLILPIVEHKHITIVLNEEWREGMASSIRVGLSALLTQTPALQNVVIALCDQPFISSSLLLQLWKAKEESGKRIIASFYNNTAGVPSLFNCKYFNSLLMLQGNDGAKKLLFAHPNDVEAIPFPPGAVDIDTTEDYERLLQTMKL